MKKLLLALVMIYPSVVWTQAQNLQIHKKDGSTIAVPLNSIDSITFIGDDSTFICGISTISDIEHPRWEQDAVHYGTDDYGFSGLPGGLRFNSGNFTNVGSFGLWWSFTQHNPNNGWFYTLGYNYGTLNSGYSNKRDGFSVRCLLD